EFPRQLRFQTLNQYGRPAMARDRQVDPNRSESLTSTTTGSPRSTSAETSGSAERERGIRTSRDEGRGTRAGVTPYRDRIQGPSSPFTLMRRMSEDMDRLFDSFLGGRGALSSPLVFDEDLFSLPTLRASTSWAPQVEVFQRGGK